MVRERDLEIVDLRVKSIVAEVLGVWDGENWGLVGHCVEMGMLKISTFVLGCGHKRVIRRKKNGEWRRERERQRGKAKKVCVFFSWPWGREGVGKH